MIYQTRCVVAVVAVAAVDGVDGEGSKEGQGGHGCTLMEHRRAHTTPGERPYAWHCT